MTRRTQAQLIQSERAARRGKGHALPTSEYSMSFDQIGAALGISRSAAEQDCRRALAKVRQALVARGFTREEDLAVHTAEFREEFGFGGELPVGVDL